MRKIYIIGDIHGCIDELNKLLDKLPITTDDLLIFVGDYIDRGPDSKAVVSRIMNLEHKNIIPLMGNHEQMMLNYLEKGLADPSWMYNGYEATVRSYDIDEVSSHRKFRSDMKNILDSEGHLDFLNSLKLFYEEDDFIVVHAGLDPYNFDERDPETLLWIREEFIMASVTYPKTVIFGHTRMKEPFIRQDRIGIDTGCVYGGPLTAIELTERKIYQDK
jgi:serine/threonine protein phosphatase 1